MRRKVYIGLPRRDPWSTDCKWVRKLERALCGARDAPQIRQEVSASLTKLGFHRSVFQPSVFIHKTREMAVVINVDDFFCSQRKDLLRMHDELSNKYEMKTTLTSETDNYETTYLNRTIKLTKTGVRLGGDPKHVGSLVKE